MCQGNKTALSWRRHLAPGQSLFGSCDFRSRSVTKNGARQKRQAVLAFLLPDPGRAPHARPDRRGGTLHCGLGRSASVALTGRGSTLLKGLGTIPLRRDRSLIRNPRSNQAQRDRPAIAIADHGNTGTRESISHLCRELVATPDSIPQSPPAYRVGVALSHHRPSQPRRRDPHPQWNHR